MDLVAQRSGGKRTEKILRAFLRQTRVKHKIVLKIQIFFRTTHTGTQTHKHIHSRELQTQSFETGKQFIWCQTERIWCVLHL